MENTKSRIMIVDDDPHAIEILTRMLGREGYECVSAASGKAALETVRGKPVDVILLDVMMPEMDGLQVCEHLRADDTLRQIPVILLTAKDDMETRARGMSLGVSEYLTKPINKRELFTRIAAQLHSRELSRRLTETAATFDDSGKSS
jgi:two-component system alkaline phosphatase synthesis response regulator PhoP